MFYKQSAWTAVSSRAVDQQTDIASAFYWSKEIMALRKRRNWSLLLKMPDGERRSQSRNLLGPNKESSFAAKAVLLVQTRCQNQASDIRRISFVPINRL
jgi:hypothetical protein